MCLFFVCTTMEKVSSLRVTLQPKNFLLCHLCYGCTISFQLDFFTSLGRYLLNFCFVVLSIRCEMLMGLSRECQVKMENVVSGLLKDFFVFSGRSSHLTQISVISKIFYATVTNFIRFAKHLPLHHRPNL